MNVFRKTSTNPSQGGAKASQSEQILRKSGKFLKIGLSLFGILAIALIFNLQFDKFSVKAALTDVSADNDIRLDGSNPPKSNNGSGLAFAEGVAKIGIIMRMKVLVCFLSMAMVRSDFQEREKVYGFVLSILVITARKFTLIT